MLPFSVLSISWGAVRGDPVLTRLDDNQALFVERETGVRAKRRDRPRRNRPARRTVDL